MKYTYSKSIGIATSLSLFAILSVSVILIREHKTNRQKRRTKDQSSNSDNDDSLTTTKSRSGGQIGKSTNNDKANASHVPREEHDWSEHLPTHILREQMKEKRRQQKLPLLAMKSQMYDNITMLDPQGNILSKISRKKGRWYVNKGLAIWVCEEDTVCQDPNTVSEPSTNDETTSIQLKFEPKARTRCNNDYGKSIKKNICVACGGEENQMRFYIVPYAYRNLFPKKYKSHISHDVVLLCANCHLRCGQQTQYRMNEMEEKFIVQKRYATDFELYKVRSSALALMNWRHKIPEDKVACHESIVRAYYLKIGQAIEDFEALSKEQLQNAIDVDYKSDNPNYVPGSKLVVDSIVGSDDKMEEFIRGWRRFFLDTIHPRHLTTGWSVDYPVMSNE
jgi:hypothetical protein